MTYHSLDIIPIKIFLKVAETGNLSLLSDEIEDKGKLLDLWENLSNEYLKLTKESKVNDRIINSINKLEQKRESIYIALFLLGIRYDIELVSLLESYGYEIKNYKDLTKDIERISRQASVLEIKIERLKAQLPKPDIEETQISIDENILSYSKIAETGFIDTNKVTAMQYIALKNIANKVIKNSKKDVGKN